MSAPVEGSRIATMSERDPEWAESWQRYANEDTWRVLDAVHEVAEQTDRSPAQVSLRWLLQRPGVTAPIVGARTLEHFEDNLGATGWSLDDEQMARLTAASDRRLPYPHDVLTRFHRRP